MFNKKVGFIGAGNMGGALASAVALVTNTEHLFLADALTEKAEGLAKKLNCIACDTAKIADECDIIFLGVKPQVMANMLDEIKGVLAKRQSRFVLVSMAAGLNTTRIAELGGNYPIIRIMPNTPVAVGEGMILYTGNEQVKEEDFNDLTTILAKAGMSVKISEDLIDAGMAVSGCGPAFAYLFIKALADGGVECGLEKDVALNLAAQTVLGAAKMVLETGKQPTDLKDAVCSPGGTTIEGVKVLESGLFGKDTKDAVKASYEKSKILGK